MTSGLERPALYQLSYVREDFSDGRVRGEPPHTQHNGRKTRTLSPGALAAVAIESDASWRWPNFGSPSMGVGAKRAAFAYSRVGGSLGSQSSRWQAWNRRLRAVESVRFHPVETEVAFGVENIKNHGGDQ